LRRHGRQNRPRIAISAVGTARLIIAKHTARALHRRRRDIVVVVIGAVLIVRSVVEILVVVAVLELTLVVRTVVGVRIVLSLVDHRIATTRALAGAGRIRVAVGRRTVGVGVGGVATVACTARAVGFGGVGGGVSAGCFSAGRRVVACSKKACSY